MTSAVVGLLSAEPASPTRKPVPGSGFIPALDGVRGVAILLVLFYHLARFARLPNTHWADRSFMRIAEAGWVGVDLFFVLSGFLITGILLDAKGKGSYYTSFYGRRAVRIFPLYYAVIALLLLVGPRLPIAGADVYGSLYETQGWLWTYMQNVLMSLRGWESIPKPLGHLWSLAVEEQFYLVWPFVVAVFSRKQLIPITIACIVAAFLLRLISALSGADTVVNYVLMPTRMDALAAGALLALLVREETGLKRLARWGMPLMVASSLGLVLLWVVRGRFDGLTDPTVQVFGFSALAMLFTTLIAHVVTLSDGSAARFFAQPWLRFFGRYSYAIYVIHHILGWHLMRAGLQATAFPSIGSSFLPGALLSMAITGAGSVALALISWNLLEKHFLRLKAYLPYDRSLNS